MAPSSISFSARKPTKARVLKTASYDRSIVTGVFRACAWFVYVKMNIKNMWIPSDLPSMPWRSFCRVWWFSVICELLPSMLLFTHRNTSRFSDYNALISSLC